MFGGLERRRSSNVRFKQLFHELKQQFPTIPDEVIANCIIEKASSISSAKDGNILELLKSRVTTRCSSEEPMGGPSTDSEVPALKTVDISDRKASVPEDSPRKKVLESRKHRKTHKAGKEDIVESSPEHEDYGSERERRKLSSLLRKTIKTIRNPSRSEHKNHVKKHHNRKHNSKKELEDLSPRESFGSPREASVSPSEASASPGEASSPRESIASPREASVSPIEQGEHVESDHFLTVSALKQHFEPKSNGLRERKTPPKLKALSSPRCSEMNKSVDKSNQNTQLQSSPKRPTSLALNLVKPDGKGLKNGLQLSERCKNLPKLLNANLLSDKPPRSPVYNKKAASGKGRNVAFDHKGVSSPGSDKEESSSATKDVSVSTGARKKETVSTPTQTTDTLLGEPTTTGSVNLSFNVNCSLDVIHSPVNPRRTSTLQVTPETPFCMREPTSPRSYTTVNLTLRPPSSIPQPPIDITSQNSSLTYSTSSFDSQKGLQKRLQITVGPTGGNVIASRVRPESGDFDVTGVAPSTKFDVPARSFPDNMAGNEESPVIVKQEKMIDRLRILLINEKTTLEVLRNEVTDLKRKTTKLSVMKQRIAHLRFQCQQLCVDDAIESDFYNNVYRGQPLAERFNPFAPESSLPHQNDYHQQEHDGWNCEICTFRNHPQLNKCEECDMPRFIHGRRLPRTISVNVLES